MRKKEESGVNPAPAMNCRAILISPYGTEKPFLSLNRAEDVMNCRAVLISPYRTEKPFLSLNRAEDVRIAGQIRFQLFV